MKKIISTVLVALLCLCVLAGCSGDKTVNEVPLTEALAEINTRFFNGGEGMRDIESLDKLELYYGITPADVDEFAAEIAKNSATEIDEVVLVKAVDESAAARVAEKLELRLDSQKALCASYSSDLLAVADKCKVRTDGVLVSLIICDSYDEAVALYEEIFFG